MDTFLRITPARAIAKTRRRRLKVAAFSGLLLFGWIAYSSHRSEDPASERETKSLAALPQEKSETQPRVGIQAGHWKNLELPAELNKLVDQSTGTSAAGYDEWQVCLTIAEKVQTILEKDGIAVDILPATIPEGYKADAFVSLHTDGNDDTTVSGFKVAPSYYDTSNTAGDLSDDLAKAFSDATKMETDPNVTSNMTQYYAFNSIKFHHAIDRDTPGALLEVGFLTNAHDRSLIVNKSDLMAEAIAKGITTFLKR